MDQVKYEKYQIDVRLMEYLQLVMCCLTKDYKWLVTSLKPFCSQQETRSD